MEILIGNKVRNRKLFLCGEGHKTLVIGSVGTSEKIHSLEEEIRKTNRAVNVGVDAITDQCVVLIREGDIMVAKNIQMKLNL